MLIENLPLADKQALAKEIRVWIESNAQADRILNECELRRYVKRKKITLNGIRDIIEVLESNYTPKVVERLISKIQKSVVWDTCLCRLPLKKLNELFFESSENIIITTAMYQELVRLAYSSTKNDSDVEVAKSAILNILEDTSSTHCTVVDVPPGDYVDTALLNYCEKNGYSLYTCDFTMGLRALARGIKVTIFHDLDPFKITSYTPNPLGKNVVLGTELLEKATLANIVSSAEKIGANKFILTYEFVELLERAPIKSRYRDLIRFLVIDDNQRYSMYIPESITELTDIVEKYNAIVLSDDMDQCMMFKMDFIPYKFIGTNIFNKSNVSSANSSSSGTTDKTSGNADAKSNSHVKSNNSKDSKIPYYNPQRNTLSIKRMPLTERIWVFDGQNNQKTSLDKKTFDAMPGDTVIHGSYNLNGSYKLNVYEIVNNAGKKSGKVLFSSSFKKDSTDTVVAPYRHYAKLMTMTT